MKITITDQGEHRFDRTVTVDWPGLEYIIDDDADDADSFRHNLRRATADFFGSYMDGRVTVRFDDERGDSCPT